MTFSLGEAIIQDMLTLVYKCLVSMAPFYLTSLFQVRISKDLVFVSISFYLSFLFRRYQQKCYSKIRIEIKIDDDDDDDDDDDLCVCLCAMMKTRRQNLYLMNKRESFSFFSVSDTGGSEEKTPRTPNRSSNYDLLASSPDSLPLSYRRRVGDKATKLGSFDKHPT